MYMAQGYDYHHMRVLNLILLQGQHECQRRGMSFLNYRISSVPGIEYFVCEAASIPVDDDSLDRLLCYSVFHYLGDSSNAEKVLDEFARVTRHGGLILIGDVLKPAAASRPADARLSGSQEAPRQDHWWPESLDHELTMPHLDSSFFVNYGRQRGYDVTVLAQDISGKNTAQDRYDIKIGV